ncbi:MAG: hypothetical protein IKT54_05620 [Clostridia bacterium]|jgi:hypothetical protein|nr:hypothetical protein [Clostridia bacterium]MBR6726063.1 hypothetical protein [Clostridia bacterium]
MKNKKRRAKIPDTIKSVISTYRVAGAMTDPFGSYTGIDALEETEAEDRVINQEVNDAHINKNGIPTQDADDL